MAKTKTKNHTQQHKDILRSASAPLVKSPLKKSQRPIEDLLTEAAKLLEQSQPELALPLAEEALQRLEADRRRQKPSQNGDETDIEELLSLAAQGQPTLPTALVLTAEIRVALGDVDPARRNFTRAIQMDKDGALISAEPWLWLAQLCEEGGRESIRYFEQAYEVLRNEIDVLEEAVGGDDETGGKKVLDEKKAKLADALCAMAEVYMTDLSWEADAEARCEALVTEAVAVCPEDMAAGALQTLASVRISQERMDEARTALKRSLDIWHKETRLPSSADTAKVTTEGDDSTDDDIRKPDFATRVSLARLLMEVQLEQTALSVLDGLVREDDQSVECWYLGGWCHVLISQKPDITSEEKGKSQRTARTWLENCLRLYRVLSYDDERLRDHAIELVDGLKKELGEEGEMDEDDDDAWEDVDGQDGGEDEDSDVELELEIEEEEDVKGHPPTGTGDGDVEMT
jgi:tetratricopeptide (TPR) repeat protein